MHDSVGGPWPAGSSVRVRGRRWTVVHQSNGSDCSLLRVRGSDPFTPSIVRTLLLPFDRPRSVPSTSTVVVTAERWLRVVQRAALEAASLTGTTTDYQYNGDDHTGQRKVGNPFAVGQFSGATLKIVSPFAE